MTAEQRFFPIWKMCLCAAVVLSLMGCAAKHGDKAVNSPDVQAVETTSSVGAASVADSDSAFEDYDDEESEAIADPLEGWNRFWFGFNDVLLLKVVKPVYTGYTYITPSPVRTGLSNAFHNIQMPIRFLNCVLQGRFGEAWIEVGRFVVNTTAGLAVFSMSPSRVSRSSPWIIEMLILARRSAYGDLARGFILYGLSSGRVRYVTR